MSKTETLHVELSEARAGLVAALAEGADTAPHRQRIADLEGQIAAIERQAREERAAASRAEADAIKRRRLAGDERSADAAELLTLTSDAEALQLLVDDANAKVAAADVRPAARAALSAAEQQLEHARRQAAYRAALERLQLVEGIFVDVWKTMVDLGRAAGNGSPWSEYRASPEAVRAVTGAIVPGFRGQL